MELLVYLIVQFVDILLSVIIFAMLGRVILSFLMFDEDGPLGTFLFAVTEPFIIPVRTLFERLGWFEGMPLDMSFFVTCVLLDVIRTVLAFIPIGG